MTTKLRAPFPYFGYKGKVSADIWQRLGNPPNYVEPFFGSGAVLLQRPDGAGRREVVNDKYGLLANFWRAIKYKPKETAGFAVWPNSEIDLHARNAYCRSRLDALTTELGGSPTHCDPQLAGYWVYVQSMAIGEAAFAKGPWVQVDGKLVKSSSLDGIRRAVPCDANRGVQKSIPFHGKQGVMSRQEFVLEWFLELSERFKNVRILCGDWSRALKPTYTTQHGLTGVYEDPPYDDAWTTYANAAPMAKRILEWNIEHGSNPQFRIALSGYSGTYIDELDKHGWASLEWTAGGGRVTTGGQSDINRGRERIKFSPHCLDVHVGGVQLSMFGGES